MENCGFFPVDIYCILYLFHLFDLNGIDSETALNKIPASLQKKRNRDHADAS